MLRKIRRSLPFLLGCLIVFVLFTVYTDQKTIVDAIKSDREALKQLSLDIDLNERKIDFLQDKFYQEHNNNFLKNNNIHYFSENEDGELIQINYDSYTKDTFSGFNTTAIYLLHVCSKSPIPCAETNENDLPKIEFKDYEIIRNFAAEKIKPTFAEKPIYIIKIETNLLNHVYFFMPVFNEESNSSYYKLINPITDQGWLRQYEGEKIIELISEAEEKISVLLKVTPIHYQVQPEIYNIDVLNDPRGGYKMEFSKFEVDIESPKSDL